MAVRRVGIVLAMPGEDAITLSTKIADVPGVTPTRTRALAALGIRNVGQLVAHLPMRHERLLAEAPISELAAGAIATARGEVTATRIVTRGPRPRFEAVLMDHTGRLDLVWFNALFMRHTIQPGVELRVQGKARRRAIGAMQMANPKHWIINPAATSDEPAIAEDRVRPVYPASAQVSSQQIEGIIARVLERALPLIDDHLSPEQRALADVPALRDAYRMIHQPRNEAEVKHAVRRLVYDELLLMQLGLAMRRAYRQSRFAAPALKHTPRIDRHIRARFPFALTPDQDKAVSEIATDLARDRPANRLLQGDVGSGKTAVAVYAMLMAAASGCQSALMAPTEILAEQHYESIAGWLKGSRVTTALLTGASSPAERARIHDGLASGAIHLVVGTHALITAGVAFDALGVAVIDEQHRFGVHQRALLRTRAVRPGEAAAGGARALVPHVLVMTATPIPRTLAMTVMGDLDASTIERLPPGRKPVATRLVPVERIAEVWAFVAKRLGTGERVFVVAPTIDGQRDEGGDLYDDPTSGTSTVAPAGVREVAERLRSDWLKDARIGVMHGRLDAAEREQVMSAFRTGKVNVLVATTVIEVGVDVPEATVMVILDADRFGLAQLHQLRGRVGRSSQLSACIVVPTPGTPDVNERLAAFVTLSDGFALAEKDLEIRGFGSMLGAEQSGMPPFKVALLPRDMDLLRLARRHAAEWIARSPTLSDKTDALARKRVMKAHGEWLGLADVG